MIGIFDFGIVGSVLTTMLRRYLPSERFVFLGDTTYSSVGNGPPELVRDRCLAACDILTEKGAELIILACHTASALGTDELARHCRIPVLEAITPVFLKAVECSTHGRIGILSSRAAIDSGVYKQCADSAPRPVKLFCQTGPLLTPLVEENMLDCTETKMMVKRYLRPLKNQQIDTFIPASSHYQAIMPLITPRLGSTVKVIKPLETMAKHVAQLMNPDNQSSPTETGSVELFVTRFNTHTEALGRRLLGKSNEFFPL